MLREHRLSKSDADAVLEAFERVGMIAYTARGALREQLLTRAGAWAARERIMAAMAAIPYPIELDPDMGPREELD